MGRRLNTSNPTVIQTTLTPLSDSFAIKGDDTLEQWYSANTGEYSPNRTIFPLRLIPTIKAVDTDTGTLYTPTFNMVVWYYFDPTDSTDRSSDQYWPGLHWVRVTDVEYGEGVEYYCPTSATNPELALYVAKNVPPPSAGASDAGQQICCVAEYIDPRDSGVTVQVKDNVTLSTSMDATTDMLVISLQAPTKTIFNPLTAADSTYTFEAKVLNMSNNSDVTSNYYIEWYGKVNNSRTAALLDTLPCYTQASQQLGKGQGTNIVSVDAMYVEHLDLVCRIRATSTSAILPAVAYCGLVWEYPKIDANTVCENGRAVNDKPRDMTFTNIVNHLGGVLTDEQKAAHLLFNFKRRISTASSYTDMGWGQKITVSSNTLRQVTSYDTPVHADVYMMGPYEAVTDDNAAVTDDGDPVFDRL